MLFLEYQSLLFDQEFYSDQLHWLLRVAYILIHCLFYFLSFWVSVFVLSTLFLFAFLSSHTQCPPGMKQQVLVFYTKLLGRIKQPLLPHINVHRPVQVFCSPPINLFGLICCRYNYMWFSWVKIIKEIILKITCTLANTCVFIMYDIVNVLYVFIFLF